MRDGLIERGDLAASLALLTRLPVPAHPPRGARAAWAWPLAGALVGLIAAAVAWAFQGFGPGIAAALALAAQALATGALHEDGLADSADGLWGGRTRERRLVLMADSRIGSYGALALLLVTLIRWQALALVLAGPSPWGALLAGAALSRWPMAALLWALPPARPGGLAASVGRPADATLALGGALALVLAMIGAGWAGLGAALAAVLVTLVWGAIALVKLRGQTGDICGAAQVLAEVAALLVLAVA